MIFKGRDVAVRIRFACEAANGISAVPARTKLAAAAQTKRTEMLAGVEELECQMTVLQGLDQLGCLLLPSMSCRAPLLELLEVLMPGTPVAAPTAQRRSRRQATAPANTAPNPDLTPTLIRAPGTIPPPGGVVPIKFEGHVVCLTYGDVLRLLNATRSPPMTL